MAELCHVCDLFRVALFGPTNGGSEDHLDDALGNDLPRPMADLADAPATMGVRSRDRPSTGLTAVAKAKPVSQLAGGGTGATATPSVASEAAAPRASSGASAMAPSAGTAVAESAAAAPAAAAAAPAPKTAPKTKFSKRATRGLKSAPAYMSFDDVDIEDDDSDGELFVDDSRDRRGSRSPGSVAASAKAASAYTVNAPSVYRAPALAPPAVAAPAPPSMSSKVAADALAGAIAVASMEDEDGAEAGGAKAGGAEDSAAGAAAAPAPTVGGAEHENMSSHQAIAGDSSTEALSSGAWAKGNLRLGGERVTSIPRDGSTLDSARPHGASESFHGYKGYPGYEPDTPVAQQLTQPGRPGPNDALTITPGADVSDPRVQKHGALTPSSVRHPPPSARGNMGVGVDMGAEAEAMASAGQPEEEDTVGLNMDSYAEDMQQQQQPIISPQATTSMEMATGIRPPEPRGLTGQIEVTTRQQRDAGMVGTALPPASGAGSTVPHGGSEAGDNTSAYGGGGGHGVPSPSHSQANSMTSSFRNIPQVPSEDGMGSVLGTLAGTDDSTNEDLQWKRSALKKFHKVMVKGEGLRVVKHNRSGGSQMRIIRYDPEIKALVWNSKRYMKKAGSANVPIVGIKRVGREGNTVSVTAAGRGTIGFEPQRIRDAKILAEALRALVDKEERSAMWRG